MKTREKEEKRRVYSQKRTQHYQATQGVKESRKKKQKERRVKKKIEEQLHQDALLAMDEKIKKMKMSKEWLQEELEKSPENLQMSGESISGSEDLEAMENKEEEELDKRGWEEFERIGNTYLLDEDTVETMTSMDLPTFKEFVAECSTPLEMTTWRGTPRKSLFTSTSIPSETFIFLTLIWLRHYPAISFLSCFFKIQPCTCTQILKRTTAAMTQVLKNEIKFPSDDEMESLQYTHFQNHNFAECVCVVDGTEIRISRPAKKDIQRKTWSGKKKQNSLNAMIITKLNGEIIYYSPLRIGAHDQSHWNELNLRQAFVGKQFGIMGDGGFTFNRELDVERIKGFKPYKTPKNGTLNDDQKIWNRKISEVRVVVENAIRAVKSYKILAGVFRHWRYGKGQINGDNILTICVTLANRRIKRNPLRHDNWTASDWKVAFRELADTGPD
jgi:hypothetical protein